MLYYVRVQRSEDDSADGSVSDGDEQDDRADDNANRGGGPGNKVAKGNRPPRYTEAEKHVLIHLYGKYPAARSDKLPQGKKQKLVRSFNKWLRESGYQHNGEQLKRGFNGLRLQFNTLCETNEDWEVEGLAPPYPVLAARPPSGNQALDMKVKAPKMPDRPAVPVDQGEQDEVGEGEDEEHGWEDYGEDQAQVDEDHRSPHSDLQAEAAASVGSSAQIDDRDGLDPLLAEKALRDATRLHNSEWGPHHPGCGCGRP